MLSTARTRGREAQRSKKGRGPRERRFTLAIPYLLPAAILYGWFLLYPIIDSIRLSFQEWNGFRNSPRRWVGLDNYERLFTADPVFWKATTNSLIWVVLSLAVPMVISLLLALALNRKMRGRNLFRSVVYIPSVFASITVAAMWSWIYNPNFGAVNQTLEALGLGSWKQQWLGDPKIALYSVFVASIWQGVGFNMVLFLAGLQQVPNDLVEAAKIDGAGAWQRFWTVVMPALRPTMVVVIIL
ncbi:MAG: sugar ABC transporter permease, partial [Bifidobacteriaceae bacterium]|nr:sugar ABC transporter permease [Bifidobacteriaceae bacterium]